MQIVVETFDQRIYKVDIDSLQDTIRSVKVKLEATEGTPMDQQCLTFNDVKLRDDHTLADYWIQDNAIIKYKLQVQNNHQIYVQTLEGKRLTLKVKSLNTLNQIKQMIEERTSTPAAMQCLFFKGRNLSEYDDDFLTSVNLYNGATLYLVRKLVGYYDVLKLKYS